MSKYKSLEPGNYTGKIDSVKVTDKGSIDYTIKVTESEKHKRVTLKERVKRLLRR